MKQILAVVFMTMLTLTGCEKENMDTFIQWDVSKIKITSISNLGTLTYDQEKLISVGSEQLLFNQSYILTNSIWANPTPQESIHFGSGPPSTREVFFTDYNSFNTVQGKIVERVLDSTLVRLFVDDELEEIENKVLNKTSARYFYDGEVLDSIIYFEPDGVTVFSRRAFQYNSHGNIVKEEVYYTQNMIWNTPVSYSSYSVEYTEYDNHPNPYNILLQQTGVLTKALENKNFSKNNPKRSIVTSLGQKRENHYTYKHNSEGLPVEIKDSIGEVVITYASN